MARQALAATADRQLDVARSLTAYPGGHRDDVSAVALHAVGRLPTRDIACDLERSTG